MTVLEVEDLHFSYDTKEVLKGVSLTARRNEIISILGPNGVGKTTLLRCICNLHKPTSGSVKVCGNILSEIKPNEMAKLVGYVPQKADVSRTTVFDSVLIGRRPHMGITYSDRDLEIAWNVIRSLGLGDKSLDYVDEISGGEFQKVQIARAIAQEPELLVLDEPSNNLDIANQHITMRMIEHVVRQHGLCTVMTMHDINLAAYYSDKFVFVKDGAVAAFGGKEVITPEVIKDVYGIGADVIEHNGQVVVIPSREQPRFDGLVRQGVGGSHGEAD
ncbi:MAG: ABC transporter ATP-binding protein [archaeon]|nr:ABC transporter ATP-binding protein [archaeon]